MPFLCVLLLLWYCLTQKEKGEGKRRELQSHLTRLQQMMTEEKTRRKTKELEQSWKVRIAAAAAGGGGLMLEQGLLFILSACQSLTWTPGAVTFRVAPASGVSVSWAAIASLVPRIWHHQLLHAK